MMNRNFEKAFRENAYNQVPDRWEDVKEKIKSVTPEVSKATIIRFGAKSIASIAASVTIVIVAVSVAVGVGSKHPAPTKETAANTVVVDTDENGETVTILLPSAVGSIDLPETTVITYVDGEGREHSTVAAIKRNGKEDASVIVSYTDVQGNTQTTVVHIPAETSAIGSTPSQSAAPATVAATTRAEIAVEIDWDKRTMPGKFPAVQFDLDGMGKEYTFPWKDSGYSSRPTTLLYSGYTLRNTNPKTDKTETATADIYAFQGFSKQLVVGVRFEGEPYPHPYVNGAYVPATLGEFLSATDYDNTIHYGNIRLFKDGAFPVNDQNKADIRKYLLSDGSVKNTNATDRPSGAKVTLAVSMDELGRSNKTMDVYESGYIWTNLIGYGYCFNVGKENVAAFLKNSYNVTFDDLAQAGGDSPGTTSSNVPAAENSDSPIGMTVVSSAPHTISE